MATSLRGRSERLPVAAQYVHLFRQAEAPQSTASIATMHPSRTQPTPPGKTGFLFRIDTARTVPQRPCEDSMHACAKQVIGPM